MKLKLVLLLISITLSHSLIGQESKEIQYDQIYLSISDESSDFYYPKLLERMFQLDTLLTDEEYHHLYYGYVFNESYDPYGETSQNDELEKLDNSEDEWTEEQMHRYISLANKSLVEFPIDLRLINMLAYCYKLNGQEEKCNQLSIIFHGFLRTIINSGDGVTSETAFHVISTSHEYVLMMMFEMSFVSQSLIDECDYLELKENEYSVEGLYFNVSKILERNLELMKK